MNIPFRVRLGAGVAAVALSLSLTAEAAWAQPATLDEARDQVEKLRMESSALDQEYAGVQERLEQARQTLGDQQADLDQQRAKVQDLRQQTTQVALLRYQQRSVDPALSLVFSSEQDSFLGHASTMEQLSRNQNAALQRFQAAQADLADLERAAQAETEEIAASEQEMGELRESSEEKLSEAERVLERLTEEERQRLAAEEAERERQAQERAEAAQAQSVAAESDEADDSHNSNDSGDSRSERPSRSGSAERNSGGSSSRSNGGSSSDDSDDSRDSGPSADSSDSDDSGEVAPPANGSRAQAAIAFAKSQLGKPYSYGASGPGSYDCSGLTGAAWKAAGVSLPRTSRAQAGAGTSVSLSNLQPGDLVFYYSPISHVALYVGGGQVIHAPSSGKSVSYAPVSYGSMKPVSARRVG